jgi:hypothetical protein
MNRDGSAEYRLKDERGVMVTKLKTDLEAMLDHLNIQVRPAIVCHMMIVL